MEKLVPHFFRFRHTPVGMWGFPKLTACGGMHKVWFRTPISSSKASCSSMCVAQIDAHFCQQQIVRRGKGGRRRGYILSSCRALFIRSHKIWASNPRQRGNPTPVIWPSPKLGTPARLSHFYLKSDDRWVQENDMQTPPCRQKGKLRLPTNSTSAVLTRWSPPLPDL